MSKQPKTPNATDDQAFKDWLEERHWKPYGPTMPNNPLFNANPETFVYHGPGRAKYESAANLKQQFLSEIEEAKRFKKLAEKKKK